MKCSVLQFVKIQKNTFLYVMDKCILTVFLFCVPVIVYSQTESSPYQNFLKIEKYSDLWIKGFWGSKKFHKSELSALLDDLTGQIVEIPADYILSSPFIETNKVQFQLISYKWLLIKGEISNDDIKNIIKSRSTVQNNWWRSSVLVGIRGKVRGFSLDDNQEDGCVVLRLDSIELIDPGKK